ncbi:hypothetical protein C8F01DRAFT_1085653 [Mycena amicta]|nr:hypothetical protein C8F01DRAFT_1085653 [Mycena amicta]
MQRVAVAGIMGSGGRSQMNPTAIPAKSRSDICQSETPPYELIHDEVFLSATDDLLKIKRVKKALQNDARLCKLNFPPGSISSASALCSAVRVGFQVLEVGEASNYCTVQRSRSEEIDKPFMVKARMTTTSPLNHFEKNSALAPSPELRARAYARMHRHRPLRLEWEWENARSRAGQDKQCGCGVGNDGAGDGEKEQGVAEPPRQIRTHEVRCQLYCGFGVSLSEELTEDFRWHLVGLRFRVKACQDKQKAETSETSAQSDPAVCASGRKPVAKLRHRWPTEERENAKTGVGLRERRKAVPDGCAITVMAERKKQKNWVTVVKTKLELKK